MTRQRGDELLTEFLGLYTTPFYDQTPCFDGETSEWFMSDKRYFEAYPDRKSFVRKSHGGEFSPSWDALFVNALGQHTLVGVDWKFKELFDREPVRLVLVQRINAANHTRQAFYLGRSESWTFEREWGCPDFIKLASDAEVKAFAGTLQERLPAEHDYCDAWLAEFFEMLRTDPVWNMRQFFRAMKFNVVH